MDAFWSVDFVLCDCIHAAAAAASAHQAMQRARQIAAIVKERGSRVTGRYGVDCG